MRKRFVTTIIVCLVAVVAAFGIAACQNSVATSVAGKTYAYENIDFEFSSDVSEEVKTQYQNNKAQMQAMYANMTIEFSEDGTFKLDVGLSYAPLQTGTYTQDGNKITITTDMDESAGVMSASAECEVNGDTLTMKQDLSTVGGMVGSSGLNGITIVTTLKEKA